MMIRVALAALSIASVAQAQLREVWARPIDTGIFQVEQVRSGAIAPSGRIYLCGSLSGSNWSFATSFDMAGNQLWFNPYNFGGTESLHAVLPVGNDEVLFGGRFRRMGGLETSIIVQLTAYGAWMGYNEDEARSVEVLLSKLCDGRIAYTSGANALNRMLNVILNEDLSVSRRAYTTAALGETYVETGASLIDCNRIYRSRAVSLPDDRSGGRFYALDDQLNELYRLNLTPGALDGGVTQGLTTLAPDRPVVGFYSYYGAGYQQHARSIGPSGETLWQTDFESIYPYAVSMNLWNDPNGYVLGSRTDPIVGPMHFLLNAQNGELSASLPWQLPPGFNRMGSGRTVWDERGARYQLGIVYNRRDNGQERDIHFLIWKLDRDFRPVWQRWIRYDDAILGWSTYWNGHLIIAGTNHPRPPLVKLKILPVFSEGDVNGDECIDDADLAKLLEGYGTANPSLDLNADGIVDATDLKELLHNFGFGCEG